MKTMNKIKPLVALITVVTLAACGTPDNRSNISSSSNTYPVSGSTSNSYASTGVIQSIETVRQNNSGNGSSPIGLGTLAGAVVGGIVGNQVGSGRGNDAATVAGIAGGAYAGHQLEKKQQPQQPDTYQFTIRMENGAYQTLMQNSAADFRVGDRVQINNGVLRRY